MGGKNKDENRDDPFFKSFSFLSHLWQEGGDAQKKEETSPNSFSSLGHLCQEGDDAKKGGGAFLQQLQLYWSPVARGKRGTTKYHRRQNMAKPKVLPNKGSGSSNPAR